jgi:hypothetical protein
MKQLYLLIITLALSLGHVNAQFNVGDYRTIDTGDSYLIWDFESSWQICTGAGDPGTWGAATTAPGLAGNEITATVYVRKTIFVILNDLSVLSTGKIIIKGGIEDYNTFYIGYPPDYNKFIYLYGELIIEGGLTNLTIQDGSRIYIKTGGKLTDLSPGNILNNAGLTGITIQSTSGTQTGSLISGTNGLTGTFNQYISAGAWHYISTPLNNTIAGHFVPSSGSAYLKPYNSPGGGWGAYINVVSTPLVVGKGYELWETANFTFSRAGEFNTGNKTLSVSSGGLIDPDWNLVGNPYPCGLDWSTISGITTVAGQAFFVYDAASNTYLSNNGSFSTGTTTSSIIPPFQGFFVKYGSATNLTVSNTNKAHPTTDLYKKQSATNENNYTNHIKLEASLADHTTRAVLVQQSEATNGLDLIYDAPMLFSNSSNVLEVFSYAGDEPASINIFGEYPFVAELGFKIPSGGGEVTLKATDLRNLDANLLVYLQDKATGAYVNFLENPTYTFSAIEGDLSDRIYLIFNNNVGIDDVSSDKIQIYSDKKVIYLNFNNYSFKGELKVHNLVGQTVYSINLSNSSYSPISLNQPSGYYFVELTTANESLTQKVFIQ